MSGTPRDFGEAETALIRALMRMPHSDKDTAFMISIARRWMLTERDSIRLRYIAVARLEEAQHNRRRNGVSSLDRDVRTAIIKSLQALDLLYGPLNKPRRARHA